MDFTQTILISLSMSVDAMTVNITNAISEKDIKKVKLILIALSFGIFQFIMPVIGYFIGKPFVEKISGYIPWIGFSLLMLLGLHSIIEWFVELIKNNKKKKESKKFILTDSLLIEESNHKKISILNILIQDIATSIDALCIGFTYINYKVLDAMIVFTIIGITTFLLSCITGLSAKYVGKYVDKYAPLIAGLVFISIAIKIIVEAFI